MHLLQLNFAYFCSHHLVVGDFMFMNVAGVWEDWVIGLILLVITMVILCTCLVLIVKILNSIFSGHVAVLLKKFVNSDFPGNFSSRYS